MYRSLLDAVDVTGDDRYGSGRTQIFYFNKGLFSKFSRGTRGLDLNAVLADLDNTHTRIGRVNETDLSEIFNMMQGEVWSPNGEANTMPAMSKTGHTSMSMGDVIMLPNGSAYMVDFSGFTNLEDGAKKMASRNVTASDRSALIKLASSLPAGSPERKAILAGLDKTAAGLFHGDNGWENHSSRLADSLKKKWINVTYDLEQNQGRANLGGLKITFRESGNDPAVIVTINETPYIKADAKTAEKLLNAISKAFTMV